MGTKKKALIITDGTPPINSFAQSFSQALNDFAVKIYPADEFDTTDLLAADVFFLGCENPNPASFSCLEELFAHINLASRKCGIFSVNKETFNYLRSILKDSEASIGEPIQINDDLDKTTVTNWMEKIL